MDLAGGGSNAAWFCLPDLQRGCGEEDHGPEPLQLVHLVLHGGSERPHLQGHESELAVRVAVLHRQRSQHSDLLPDLASRQDVLAEQVRAGFTLVGGDGRIPLGQVAPGGLGEHAPPAGVAPGLCPNLPGHEGEAESRAPAGLVHVDRSLPHHLVERGGTRL